MTTNVLNEKIESIRRCLDRIRSNTPGTFEELAADVDAQDILSVNFERAVQLCVDISATIISEFGGESGSSMASLFEALAEKKILERTLTERLVRAVSFRNLLVHQYKKIDWALVHNLATNNLDDFKQFILAIMRWKGE